MGERFLNNQRPSLEAQITNLSDEIAYNNHDVDDGLRSGLITLEQLSRIKVFARHLDQVKDLYPGLEGRRLIHETVRRMISTLVTDLTTQTRENIKKRRPSSVDDVRKTPPLASFSLRIEAEQNELKQFLRRNLYQHYRVARMSAKARRIVGELFAAFTGDPRLLPPQFQETAQMDSFRATADYVAGMTDRYAIIEHRRLFAVEEASS